MNRIISEEQKRAMFVQLYDDDDGDYAIFCHGWESAQRSLQPPSGQAGEAIELAIRILNQESSMNGCIKGTIWADDHTTLVELLENTLEALRQPVETVNEWNALTKEEMWDEIQAIRKLTDNDGTMSPRHSVANLVEELEALRTQPQAPVVEADKRDVVLPWVELQDLLFYFHTVGDEKAESMLRGLQPVQSPMVEVPTVDQEALEKRWLEQSVNIKDQPWKALVRAWYRTGWEDAIHALLQSKGGKVNGSI